MRIRHYSPHSVVHSSLKKHLNVDSPSFTPSSTPLLGINGTSKKPHGLSPKAASAAPFKPKSFTLVNEIGSFHKKQYHLSAPEWGLGPPADVSEFVPRSHSVTPSIVSTTIFLNLIFIWKRLWIDQIPSMTSRDGFLSSCEAPFLDILLHFNYSKLVTYIIGTHSMNETSLSGIRPAPRGGGLHEFCWSGTSRSCASLNGYHHNSRTRSPFILRGDVSSRRSIRVLRTF